MLRCTLKSQVKLGYQLAWRLSCSVGGHHRMSSSLPVAAVCQVTATPDKEANFSACERLVEGAKEGGASMVFLPEGFDYIGSSRDETLALSESLTGDIISRYTQLASWDCGCPWEGSMSEGLTGRRTDAYTTVTSSSMIKVRSFQCTGSPTCLMWSYQKGACP